MSRTAVSDSVVEPLVGAFLVADKGSFQLFNFGVYAKFRQDILLKT